MAGTTITSSVTIGVGLTAAGQNPVTISGSGTIDVAGTGASAIYAPFGIPGTIVNAGMLEAPSGYGVFLRSGGAVTNGSAAGTTAKITGGVSAIKLGVHGAATVDNFGTIASTGTAQGIGVQALGNATVANGGTADTAAEISGYIAGVEIGGAGATVANFGTITATGTSTVLTSLSFGVSLLDGGLVANGSATDTKAIITSADYSVRIEHAPGTVVNFGTIKSTGPAGRAVRLDGGGSVTNNTAGYIGASDRTAVYIAGPAAALVTNLGTIKSGLIGVALQAGGTLTNGSATDKTASISAAHTGVYVVGILPSAIGNFGTIAATNTALNLYLGGTVVNGSAGDTAAAIVGGTGIYASGISTVTNFGAISGTSKPALSMRGGGTVINGSVTDTTATIANIATTGGNDAIYDNIGVTTVTNFGKVSSSTGTGIGLNNGGVITNGSTADRTASILGAVLRAGIFVRSGPATVINFGTVLAANTTIGNDTGIELDGGGATLVNDGLTEHVKLMAGGSVANQAGGTIVGGFNVGGTANYSGIYVDGAAGTVTNAGLVKGTGSYGVHLNAGGTVTNLAGATISSSSANGGAVELNTVAATLVNGGVIVNTGPRAGVFVDGGGLISNNVSASISGGLDGVFAKTHAVAVVNSGKIAGTGTNGIGVDLTAGGSVTNAASASIVGAAASPAIYAQSGAVMVVNSGTVRGGGIAVDFASATATVINGGTIANIAGAIGTAIKFGSGAERLVVDPGAVFIGTVSGGSGANTMELASAASAGTIGGLGTQFIGFTQVAVDAGANWKLTGGNTNPAGATITDKGSLSVAASLVNGGSVGGGVTLLAGASLTNSAGGIVSNPSGVAVYSGSASAAVGLINGGTIGNAGFGAQAVLLEDGGRVSNAATGTITGGRNGVEIEGAAGTVFNAGTIIQSTTTAHGALALVHGGSISNASTGTISGDGGPGVYGAGTPLTVVNAGRIVSSTQTGVALENGGNVTNQAGGTISAAGAHVGVYTTGAAGTVVNAGLVTATGASHGVALQDGGVVSNLAGGTIMSAGFCGVLVKGAPGTVVNAGRIAGAVTRGSGVYLEVGGSITNASSASISGYAGADITGAIGTVVNAGSIAGAGTEAVGVFLGAGGSVTNAALGLITGAGHGSGSNGSYGGVDIIGATGTVLNSGSIAGPNGVGVFLGSGGSVTNAASGSISGATYGVDLMAGGTLTNAGSITGGGGTAVAFGGTGSNRLVLDPGGGFSGKVSASTSAGNTMELASAASVGTVGGLGITFTGFQNTVVDASAQWKLTGTDTVATLTDNGTLTIAGSLDVGTAVAPLSSGLFVLSGNATLEVASDTGAGTRMQFLNPSELIVDTAAAFGTGVGTTAYTGPLIENFAVGDSILLKNVLAAGSVLNYSTTTGLLQLTGGGTATLLFQTSSLGAGAFQVGIGPSGHALITLTSGGGGGS